MEDLEVSVDRIHATKSLEIHCPRCGTYIISQEFSQTIQNDIGHRWWLVSGFIKNRGNEEKESFNLTKETAAAAIQAAPRDAIGKLNHLVLLFGKLSKFPGDWVRFHSSKDYTYSFSESPQEFRFLLDQLEGEGLIVPSNDDHRLTIGGWRRVRELASQSTDLKQGFVAMSFSKPLRPAFEQGHSVAIKRSGFEPIRLDYLEHIDKIDDRIIVEINRSRFVVADVTEQRPGVYFEAGYALGRGLPVIWCCQKDEIKEVHFDVRQFNHIVWDEPSDLQVKLETRIRAIIP